MQKLCMILLSSALVVGSSLGMELSLSVKKEINSNGSPVNQLIKAIESRAFDTCKSIIEKYPDVVNSEYVVKKDDLCTPLHSAVDRNNLPAAELLLTHKALINAQTKVSQYTPLHIVRSKEMAKLLVSGGADLHSKTKLDGKTPLSCILFSWLPYGCKRDNKFFVFQRYEAAHYLLKKGADSNALIDRTGDSLLHMATEFNDARSIQLLLRYNANSESKNLKGKIAIEMIIRDWSHKSLLMAEFRDKRIIFFPGNDVIELLQDGAKGFKNLMILGKHAEDKKKTENVLAQLFMMLQQGDNDFSQSEKIIKYVSFGYLFKNASFTDLGNMVGQEGIKYVKKHLHRRCHEALRLALDNDYKPLEDMIERFPFIVAYDKKIAFTILQHMIMEKNWIYSFLDSKPDLSMVDDDGNTLLHVAIRCKSTNAIAAFIAKNDVNFTIRNRSQQTPLDLLYDIGDEESIDAFYNAFADRFFSTYSHQVYYQEIKKILKATKFDINVRDTYDKSLLHRAVVYHPEKCSLLLKCGARVMQQIIDSAQSEEVRSMLQKKYDEQLFK